MRRCVRYRRVPAGTARRLGCPSLLAVTPGLPRPLRRHGGGHGARGAPRRRRRALHAAAAVRAGHHGGGAESHGAFCPPRARTRGGSHACDARAMGTQVAAAAPGAPEAAAMELVFGGERCEDARSLKHYGVCENWIAQVSAWRSAAPPAHAPQLARCVGRWSTCVTASPVGAGGRLRGQPRGGGQEVRGRRAGGGRRGGAGLRRVSERLGRAHRRCRVNSHRSRRRRSRLRV